jgi:hypothetical protein
VAAGKTLRRPAAALGDRDVGGHADAGNGQDRGGYSQIPLCEHDPNAMNGT